MITATQLRSVMNVKYPHTRTMPLDHAIAEVRRIRAADAEWNRSLDEAPGGRNEQDRAYDEWRNNQ